VVEVQVRLHDVANRGRVDVDARELGEDMRLSVTRGFITATRSAPNTRRVAAGVELHAASKSTLPLDGG